MAQYVAAPPSPSSTPPVNPLTSASLLSQLLVLWFQPLVSLGARLPLSFSDLYPVCLVDSCAALQRRLSPLYSSPSPESSLAGAFLRLFRRPLLLVFANYCLYIAAMALQSYVAQALLDYLHSRVNIFRISNGYALVALMAAVSVVAITCRNFAFFLSSRVGTNMRSLVMSCIFYKSLRLSSAARQQYTTGQVLTLMSVDAERVFNAMMQGPWLFVAPLGFVVCLVLIGLLFDAASALCGLVVLVFVLSLSVIQAKKISAVQRQLLSVVDERVKVTSEALQGVRVIKFYAWEQSIASRVLQIRDTEVSLFRKLHMYMVSNSVLLFLTPVFLSGSTLGLYVLLHGAISVTDAFTLVALVNICRAVVNEFTSALAALSQARSSFRRIDKFLASDEFETPERPSIRQLGRVFVRNAHAEWPSERDGEVTSENSFALKGLNLTIEPGSLVMIVGAVGAGKSSFLQFLLGEMAVRSGECLVDGDISYVSQEPWIRNSSVKSNILFESPFDSERYERVLEASQLSLDLHALPNGDQTEIGEKGINLSGGQKARVAIARAFYRSQYDILVLDDPLSAVDPHVAHAIFDDGIVALAAGKTRLLVLNSHYDLLARADKIIVFQDGQIVGDGSYHEVVSRFPNLRYESKQKSHSIHLNEEQEEEENRIPLQPAELKKDVNLEATRLVKAEDRVTGTVGARIYRAYLDETGGNGIVVLLVLLVAYSVSQGLRVLVDWWQGHWASNMTRRGVDPTYSATVFGMWYLGFIVVCTVLTLGRGFLMAEVCVRSAKNLHEELFHRVLSAPITRYFDVTPIGRILNRFSNDLDQMDSVLPQQYQMMFQNVAMSVGSLVVSAVSSYWICVAYIPMLVVFVFTGRYFNKTSREVKRLEGISRSPVYNLFGETLSGLQTIRAFKMQRVFTDLSEKVVDENTAAYFSYCAAGRWLAVRLDWLSVLVIFVVSLYLVATKGQISPVIAGLSLTYSLMLMSTMQNTVRSVDSTDNAMTSVERLLHFRSIPVEQDSSECLPIDDSWPSQGAIKFDHLCLKYRPELPLVLRGVAMEIAAGEKIGICGRTGAGKSSLMIALFRICEFDSGTVWIDGLDIQKLRLNDLRRSLAIIPQDPVLFSGTLRENLDPFGTYSDVEMWAVLQQVHLADAVAKWGSGLDFIVSEAGSNLSVGQRQLLCIGRALLKNSKIVVLDEATASVDSATDSLIQATIKQTFVDKTVLTIAHRIDTILHCDKIAVMDSGRVAEFASPTELLAKPNSAFAALVKRTASTN
ncbi:ABC transporter C family member 3 [Phytophthora citrophthora]|uniref:ABC transporter C family member 3 n=1 Tax=Phytophthora citrophthora TaxID=4793 RepID=A0AAD9LMK5_9STRA|nr:ABC transporter C family member 3 [Phytophthora citrophthora]